MTFGEKLKQARLNAKMTQEQLAKKMLVSRSAIAKWESDKGMPDINNLKLISQLLDISMDYLLDENKELDLRIIKTPIDLKTFGKGRKKVLKDRAIRSVYPNAKIMTLIAQEQLTKGEKIVDTAVFLLTPLIDVIKFAKGLNNLDNEFYLVNDDNHQYLVVATSEFIEAHELNEHINEKKFSIGNYEFMNCGEILYGK